MESARKTGNDGVSKYISMMLNNGFKLASNFKNKYENNAYMLGSVNTC